MLAGFAAQGRLRIATLTLDDRPIAAGAMLTSRDRAFFWKTAFDERLAAFSPGVQLTLALSADLANDPTLKLADSCADPDHPMIDRIWSERIALADFVLPLSDQERAVSFALAARSVKADVRARAKRALAGLRPFFRAAAPRGRMSVANKPTTVSATGPS